MSRDTQPESKSWWQTLPGVLTAVAALITAITGLLVAIHQAGWFNHANPDQAQNTSRSADHPHETTRGSSQAAGLKQIAIPEDAIIHTRTATYRLLSGHVEPAGPGRIMLRIGVRMTNESTVAANFWSASFRLVVRDELLPPVNLLNEVVEAASSKTGDLIFQLPASTTEVGLQMGDVGPGKPAIQIRLP